MSRARNATIGLAAAIFALLLVYGVYTVLIRQVELQRTVRVVAPKHFVPSGTILTRDMLEYMNLTEGGVRDGMLTDLDKAVGMEALVPLGTREPVLGWKLDRFRLMPAAGQATFPVPKEYILSVPGSIRAGDRVLLYASGKLGTERLLTGEVTVASVKSSANTEVDDPKQSHLMAEAQNDRMAMYAARRDANGTVEQVNLNMTEEEWRAVDEACRGKANKLVIAFRSSAVGEEEESGR